MVDDRIKKAVDDGIPFEEVVPPLRAFDAEAYIHYKAEKEAGPEKLRRIDKERSSRSARRWNRIIYLVNAKEKPKESDHLNEGEMYDYERMAETKELQDRVMRKECEERGLRFCPLIYENVEIDWK